MVDRMARITCGWVSWGRRHPRRCGSVRSSRQRVAWELAIGPIPPHQRVTACAVERRCVRVEHLSLGSGRAHGPTVVPHAATVRTPRGSGSIREVHPGYWAVTVATSQRCRYVRVVGGGSVAEHAVRVLRAAAAPTTVNVGRVVTAFSRRFGAAWPIVGVDAPIISTLELLARTNPRVSSSGEGDHESDRTGAAGHGEKRTVEQFRSSGHTVVLSGRVARQRTSAGV